MNKINLSLERINQSFVILLIVSLLMWSWSFSPFWVSRAEAAQLTSVSDTLSNSNNSAKSNHTVKFTTQSAVTASSTITVNFGLSFQTTTTPAFSAVTPTDYDFTTSTVEMVVAGGNCPGTGTTKFEITSITTGVFTFTHCNGTDALAATTPVTIKIGTNAVLNGFGVAQIANPPVTGSYVVGVTSGADNADARVAILPNVTVTASVATNLTFTITGVASGQANANDGGTTSITTAPAAIAWGLLGAGASSTARQDLSVSTNAKNGFTVTLIQDQDLTSTNGANINAFKDAVLGSPVVWTSPAATIDNPDTFGHQGITSEDSTLSNGDPFGTALFRGMSSSTPVEVMFHTGPANGTTADKGATRIGFKIEISSLQEAATDYTQKVTYVATPIF